MDHKEVGHIWDQNAENWTKLVRMGCDLYRDYVNTPAFMKILPDVKGLRGLDVGCGEGHNTRLVAQRGARMAAVEISSVFLKHAREAEGQEALGIDYQLASAVELPFEESIFDFVMATMSLMDVPETKKAVQEMWRVVKPGGFVQFSISHPCFSTPKWDWECDAEGHRVALKCGDYFERLNGDVVEWIFGATPPDLRQKLPKFRIPVFTRTLSEWLNLFIDTGFVLEQFVEPKADDETVKRYPSLADTQVIAYFLIVRCRKPADVSCRA